MRRALRGTALTALLVLLSARVWADWAGDYWLSLISAVVQEISATRMAVEDALQRDLLGLDASVFPGSEGAKGVFGDIGLLVEGVTSIRSDVKSLSCDFRFSARTVALRDGLLGPFHFCKPSVQGIWGQGSGWTSDLEELHDASSSLGLNVLSARVDAEDTSWAAIWTSLEAGAEHRRRSPGEANRDEAVALSGAGFMAVQDAKLKAMKVLVDETDGDLERFLERKEADFAGYLLGSVAETPQGAH